MTKSNKLTNNKLKLFVSLAVHENLEVIKDTIENIQYYLKNPIIVIHARKDIYGDLLELPKIYNQVFLNSTSFYTGYTDGSLFFVHYANLIFAKNNNLNYDYFIPFGSNQLFINRGLEQKISNLLCATTKQRDHSKLYHCPQYTKFYYDSNFNFLDKSKVCYAPPEGTYYHGSLIKDLIHNEKIMATYMAFKNEYQDLSHLKRRVFFNKLYTLGYRLKLLKFFPKKYLIFSYALEEIIFPNLACRVNKQGDKYCYINWKDNLKVTIQDVDELRKSKRYQAVKRVDRLMTDPLRAYIKKTSNNYNRETE